MPGLGVRLSAPGLGMCLVPSLGVRLTAPCLGKRLVACFGSDSECSWSVNEAECS